MLFPELLQNVAHNAIEPVEVHVLSDIAPEG
jgi:hypothetical protein